MATKGFVCNDHNPGRHLDGKEPWCVNCGKTRRGYEPRALRGGDRYVPSNSTYNYAPNMR